MLDLHKSTKSSVIGHRSKFDSTKWWVPCVCVPLTGKTSIVFYSVQYYFARQFPWPKSSLSGSNTLQACSRPAVTEQIASRQNDGPGSSLKNKKMGDKCTTDASARRWSSVETHCECPPTSYSWGKAARRKPHPQALSASFPGLCVSTGVPAVCR